MVDLFEREGCRISARRKVSHVWVVNSNDGGGQVDGARREWGAGDMVRPSADATRPWVLDFFSSTAMSATSSRCSTCTEWTTTTSPSRRHQIQKVFTLINSSEQHSIASHCCDL
jgi:hypothetical protein